VDTRQLRAALAVEEHGSFTAAAAGLFLSQPTLSRQVAALEHQLGAVLFHRSARRAVLTEAGRSFLPRARSTLASLETARQAARAAGLATPGGRGPL
jgi:DNA-binding transcriptional LysR family regulator